MTPQPNNLEVQGNLQFHSLAELLAEIAAAKFDGSLKLAHGEQKSVVYFSAGKVVFAVSNARSARLFDILLREERIEKRLLAEMPDFANDFAFAKFLIEKNVLTKPEIDRLMSAQIHQIICEAIEWKWGEWSFSALARIREGIRFSIDLRQILVEYARKMPPEKVYNRFRSTRESFTAQTLSASETNLLPHEAFVLSRFAAGDAMTIEEMRRFAALSEGDFYQMLYALWLGGFLVRSDWNSAFSADQTAAILSAKLTVKKEVETPAAKTETPAPAEPKPEPDAAPPAAEDSELSLEEYLTQIENALNHYEILDIEPKATVSEIKTAYFGFAKRFHPDRFHKTTDALQHSRIQHAFTQIAQAYDVLKNEDTRGSYDFKMRKDLAERERLAAAGIVKNESAEQIKADAATENFDQGFNYIMDGSYGDAVPFLARAVHLAPATARFHAYLGKALADDETQRHKAESALQTAVKLDAQNPTFRIMLIEFFIQYKLFKRAEGELTRLLSFAPDNREAKLLLAELKNK